ncbi:MAG TPA: O-antigen ligase family protein [Anaerolineales bacterium]|nr:O-antigen ligase family protein [Anaerolineales bacterium]
MRRKPASSRLERATRVVWGLVLLTIPVTTFRYVPDFMGRTLVQPMAIYPLAFLVILLVFRFIRVGRFPLPANIRLLLAFLLFVAIASVIGLALAPPPLRGTTYDERVLRGWFSLLIGILFFMAAFWMNRSEGDLRYSLKWIYAGLILTILWSLVQAIALNTSFIPRGLVNQLQLSFSSRPLLPRRISGFAYEPAWLADQIVIFYLPWLFAAILGRRPLLRYHWFEPLLFLLSIAILFFTYSRGGLLIALLCMVLTLLLFGRGFIARIWMWFSLPFRGLAQKQISFSPLAVRLGLTAFLVVGLISAASFLSRYEYFSRIWEVGDKENLVDYLIDISAGQRLAYVVAGYKVYEETPFTGVGLGASALYLFNEYPEWSFSLPEIARQLSPDSNQIPNTKSLYSRLLAETGLPGFWLFVVFFVSFLAVVRRMAISKSKFLRFVAMAGFFAWLGIGLRNLTQDSFTIPIMWVILGVLAGLYPLQVKEFRLKGKI